MSPIQPILDALKKGEMVAVSDDPARENEADLIIAAQYITVAQMAFIIRHSSGIVCVAMEEERLAAVGLHRLPTDNPSTFDTPFTISVDAKAHTRGGVSAQERVATVRTLIDAQAKSEDLARPGHVFPLIAHAEGLRGRRGHTEAGVDLMKQAKLYPAAIIAELMNEDGTMMRGEELRQFTKKHAIPLCTIDDIMANMA